jgi:hypothetical protein
MWGFAGGRGLRTSELGDGWDNLSRHAQTAHALVPGEVGSYQPMQTNIQSPWQNGIAERWVGSCRREILDRVNVLTEQHLRRLIRDT